jgi:hypothetical protein
VIFTLIVNSSRCAASRRLSLLAGIVTREPEADVAARIEGIMKHVKATFAALLIAAVFILTTASCDGASLRARVEVSGPQVLDIGVFYDELSPYGRWFVMEGYGWVWTPSGVAYGWRPFTSGYWVYTDWGWTWVSYWRWGWAPFHYGRWGWHSQYGWYWVPGITWGPGWVTWRYRPGWVGWAPLPPHAGWRAGFGLEVGQPEIERLVSPHWWSFVEERRFTDRNLSQHIALEARNVTLMRNSKGITDYKVSGDRIINRGIDVDQLERDTGQKIRRHRVVDNAAARPAQVKGDDVVLFRPKIEKTGRARAPRTTELPGLTKDQADREQRKADKQAAAEESKLEKQQRQEKQQLDEQIRNEEKRARQEQKKLEEQRKVETKTERPKVAPPQPTPGRDDRVEPKQRPKPPDETATQKLDNQHNAERQALKEQRAREQQVLRNKLETQRKVAPSGKTRANQPQPARKPKKP